MNIQQAISCVIKREDISYDDMLQVMRTIMSGDASPAQIAGLLVGLSMKGETLDEVTAAATVMREMAVRVNVSKEPLIDTCGTGGGGLRSFNVSTATTFVVAAAGGYVAKHGNRSVSSSSGSADALEQAGACIELSPHDVARSIEETGVGFMFAPAHHGATRHAAGARRELGIRTMFNALGPLTNPAGAERQLVGVFDRRWQRIVVEALAKLGSRRAFVVNADDGLDEISIGGNTTIATLQNGAIDWFEIDPRDYGFEISPITTIVADNAAESLAIIDRVFRNEPGPARDIVCLNAGAAIYLCDLSDDLTGGIKRAAELLANGSVEASFKKFIEFTRQFNK